VTCEGVVLRFEMIKYLEIGNICKISFDERKGKFSKNQKAVHKIFIMTHEW
jgi:hypothetical protein